MVISKEYGEQAVFIYRYSFIYLGGGNLGFLYIFKALILFISGVFLIQSAPRVNGDNKAFFAAAFIYIIAIFFDMIFVSRTSKPQQDYLMRGLYYASNLLVGLSTFLSIISFFGWINWVVIIKTVQTAHGKDVFLLTPNKTTLSNVVKLFPYLEQIKVNITGFLILIILIAEFSVLLNYCVEHHISIYNTQTNPKEVPPQKFSAV